MANDLPPISNPPAPPAGPPAAKRPAPGGGLGCLGCLAIPVVVIIIVGIVSVISSLIGGDSGTYDMNNSFEAIAQCEARIKDMLKAPSTAEFHSEASGSGTWTVTGTVDAENSFGAKIRSTYQCTVEMHPDSETATTTVDSFDG